jgi:hypothetical protein
MSAQDQATNPWDSDDTISVQSFHGVEESEKAIMSSTPKLAKISKVRNVQVNFFLSLFLGLEVQLAGFIYKSLQIKHKQYNIFTFFSNKSKQERDIKVTVG